MLLTVTESLSVLKGALQHFFNCRAQHRSVIECRAERKKNYANWYAKTGVISPQSLKHEWTT